VFKPDSKMDIGDMAMQISIAHGIWWIFSVTLCSSPSLKKGKKVFKPITNDAVQANKMT